jgi:hypothetical protein
MTAILTDTLKKIMIQKIFDDVADSDQNYYITIGRSEGWDSSDTVPTGYNTIRDIRNARLGFQSMKSAEDVSFVVPRNNWSSGTIYSAWDDNCAGYPTNSYYIMNSSQQVYVCLHSPLTGTGSQITSTVEPSGTSAKAFTTVDAYVWKFLYSSSPTSISTFLTANYNPIKLALFSDSDAASVEQYSIQGSAVNGQITDIVVSTGGTGYGSTPAVTVIGDGDSAVSATATISSGVVIKIEIDNDSSAMGSGFNYAAVSFSGGSPTTVATARAVIAPGAGLGADPRDDLKATKLMFNTKPNGTESGSFIVDQDFRQVSLIRNPKIPVTDSDFIASVGSFLPTLIFDTVSVAFTPDKIINGGTSGASAYVDDFDSDTLYYHQTETTGFTAFAEGEAITETNGSGSGILDSAGVDGDSDAFTVAGINSFSGDILYFENRAAVERSTSQTEDIKVIIGL